MLFRVLKPFTWDGADYNRGDHIDIPEGHPRLEALKDMSHHITYDATIQPPKRPRTKATATN